MIRKIMGASLTVGGLISLLLSNAPVTSSLIMIFGVIVFISKPDSTEED